VVFKLLGWVIILINCVTSSNGLMLENKEAGTTQEILSPRIRRYSPASFQPIVGELYYLGEIENVTGRIIFILSLPWGTSLDKAAKELWQNSALAIVTTVSGPWDPGHADLVDDPYENIDGVVIPVVEVGLTDGISIFTSLLNNVTFLVNITDSDEHAWEIVFHSAWQVFPAFLTVIGFICMLFAMWKLYTFVKVNGWELSIAQFSLIVEILVNLFRVIYTAVDPFFSRHIFWYTTSLILMEMTVPWTIINTLLVCLYWHELMADQSFKSAIFLRYMKIPFLIIALFLIAFQIGGGVMMAEFGIYGLAGIDGVLATYGTFLVFNVLITIFLLVTGSRILWLLHDSTSTDRRNSSFIRSTNFIMLSSSGHILYSICFAFSETNLFIHAWNWFCVKSVSYVAGYICSACQIAAFNASPTKVKHTRSTPAVQSSSN